MGWEIVLFVFAIAFALKVGAKALVNAFKNRWRAQAERKAHKSQLVTAAIEAGVAPKEAKAAADAAARAAVTVSTWAAIRIAALRGWREGWKEGKRRGAELRDGTQPADEPDSSTGGQPQEQPSGAERADQEPSQAALCNIHFTRTERLHQELVVYHRCVEIINHTKCPVGHEIPQFCEQPVDLPSDRKCAFHKPKTQEKGKVMTIETRAGGEVHSLAQLLTELDAIKAEAAAELEDAQANSKRKHERVQHIDTLVASLRTMKVDEATVGAVQALQEPFQQSKVLADNQATSADHELALATAARETAQRNHGQIREAVVAAPAPAADGEFYNE